MRYALLIPDGAADRPHPSLGGKTPLEVAHLPHFHQLAREGCLGRTLTVPDSLPPGSDVANLSVLGYDPKISYTGRAPLEAASLGIELGPDEVIFRANLVTIEDGRMKDYSGGAISTEDGRLLITELSHRMGIDGVRLYAGVGYRHLCVFEKMAEAIPDRPPPHDITGCCIEDYPPQGPHAARLLEVETRSRLLLPELPTNKRRIAEGHLPITQLWLWGGGVMPKLVSFAERYGLSGGIISAVDLLKGIAKLIGLEILIVPGATGYYDTNYAGKGEAAILCLSQKPFVAIHVEAPDEAGHHGDAREKIRALENIDRWILGPLLREGNEKGDLRILCLPDHATPLEVKTHTREPVPYALWGPGIPATKAKAFTERESAQAPVLPATDLMAMLLRQ